jgi:hypothetical protein
MLVPPGDYRVAIDPTQYNSQRFVFPQTIHLEENQRARVRLTSGIELAIPERYGRPWRWEVLPLGSDEAVVQWQTGDLRRMLLAPGRYRVAVEPTQYDSQRVIWSPPFDVVPDRFTQAALTSSVEIETPADSKTALWKWEAVDAHDPGKVVQWQRGDRPMMLVPPGDYRVAIDPTQYNSQRLVFPQTIHLKENQHAVVRLTSGIELALPERYGRPWKWEALPLGSDETIVQWQTGDLRRMLLAPGRYRVAIDPTQYNSQRVIWSPPFDVVPDRFTPAALTSGIRFAAPADKQPDFQFRFLDLKSNSQVQWGNDPHSVQLLPPGDYRVEVRKTQFDSWQTHVPKITIEAGTIREVPWTKPPAAPPPKQNSSGAGIRRN